MSESAVQTEAAADSRGFEHDAFFYADIEAFLDRVGQFVTRGIESGAAILVATDTTKCGALRDHLGSIDDLSFVDMATVGRNPGRIIPVWRDFVADAFASGRGARGVGEPVWPVAPKQNSSSAATTNRCSTSRSAEGRRGR